MITLKEVRKTYHRGEVEIHALRGVNLVIESGEFLAVTGKSGCGKSTLLHLMGGLEAPSAGEILVNGRDLSRLSEAELTLFRRDQVGVVFQTFNLLPLLTLEENVALPRVLQGASFSQARQEARQWLAEVGLSQRLYHKPHQVSGGELQRAAIARALINRPTLILADEPTGNLDSRASEEIAGLLRQISSTWERTILMVTHDARIAAYADRIVFLKDGKIVDETVLEHRNGEQAEMVADKMKEIGD